MLEKGVVLVFGDELERYLKTYLSEEPGNALKKVAGICFDNQASAVVLFINKDKGTYRCSCYSPIYESPEVFEQCNYDYKDIDGCIFLAVFFTEDAKALMDSELFFTIKEMAVAAGYWREEHATLVHR